MGVLHKIGVTGEVFSIDLNFTAVVEAEIFAKQAKGAAKQKRAAATKTATPPESGVILRVSIFIWSMNRRWHRQNRFGTFSKKLARRIESC